MNQVSKLTVFFVILFSGMLIVSCAGEKKPIPKKSDESISPHGEENLQAVSLLGESLYPPTPSQDALDKYDKARSEHERNPDDADAWIWYGRRAAYLGRYTEAIAIFSDGIERFPEDARFLRHRGHRHISLRAFDRAVSDFEKAAEMIKGKEDEIEPDGMPNAKDIPLSTLHTNIWYHLGLAYYLKNDMEQALRCYNQCLAASKNDDMKAATLHWLYMTLRRMGKNFEAQRVVKPVRADMEIIENQAYHKLCLLYKGINKIEDLTVKSDGDIMDDALAYGIGNWYYYNGDTDSAKDNFERITRGPHWASFGFIAAEADFQRFFFKPPGSCRECHKDINKNRTD